MVSPVIKRFSTIFQFIIPPFDDLGFCFIIPASSFSKLKARDGRTSVPRSIASIWIAIRGIGRPKRTPKSGAKSSPELEEKT